VISQIFKKLLTVEDLWDLPLLSRSTSKPDLDSVAKALNKAIKEAEEESFVVKRSNVSKNLQIAFDIVKHIIEVKMAEAESREKAAANKAKREKILELMANKEEQEMSSLSREDLQKMLDDLESGL